MADSAKVTPISQNPFPVIAVAISESLRFSILIVWLEWATPISEKTNKTAKIAQTKWPIAITPASLKDEKDTH